MKRILTLAIVVLLSVMVLSACNAPNQFNDNTKTESIPAESSADSEITKDQSIEISEETIVVEPEAKEASEESPEKVEPVEEETTIPSHEITGGTTLEQAEEVGFNTRYTGLYREGESWFSFTTGEKEDVPYCVTMENLRVGSDTLYAYLIDVEGTVHEPVETNYSRDSNTGKSIAQAGSEGRATSGMINTLKPKTTYYLKIQGGSKAEYSLRINDPTRDAFDPAAGRKTISAENDFQPATNMDEAPLLDFNTRYLGQYTEGRSWVAFTTGSEEDVLYQVTLVNLKVGSDTLYAYLYDADGKFLEPLETNYDRDSNTGKTIAQGSSIGRAASGWINTLTPNTTYFLMIKGGGKADYSLRITDPTQDPYDTTTRRQKISGTDEYQTATNMDEAPILNVNIRYQGEFVEGYHWVSFTTGDEEDVTYQVTLENLKVGSDPLYAYLYDEFGEVQIPDEVNYERDWNTGKTICQAEENGRAATGRISTLKPNTTYILRIHGDSKADYSLRITDPMKDPYNAAAGRKILSEEEYAPATNMDDASLMHYNTPYQGKYIEGNDWIAFTTGSVEDIPYSVTLENLSVGSSTLYAYLYDEYGNVMVPDNINYDRDWNTGKSIAQADESGTPKTGTVDHLHPNTTYFIRVKGGSKAEYMLTIDTEAEEETKPGKQGSEEGPEAEPEEEPENEPGEEIEDEPGEEGSGEVSEEDELIEPGTNRSHALNIPLGTKVFGKYIDGFAWVAFTTTDIEDATYCITGVNCSVGSETMYGYLYNRQGTRLEPVSVNYDRNWNTGKTAIQAEWNGTAATGTTNLLKPNTTYFIRLQGDGKARYSLKVTCLESEKDAGIDTSANIEEAKGALSPDDEFYTGTNQNIAAPLRTNTEYFGHYEEGSYGWVSFTTGDIEDAEYSVTLENLSANAETMYAYLYDEYGNRKEPVEINFSRDWNTGKTIAQTDKSGTPGTGMINNLDMNTTYYVRIEGDSKADYMILIGAPETEKEGSESAEEEEEVIPIPFELNETQVRFVANEAIFFSEEAAKDALAPVAELLLEHPDYPVLLAGTTARWGSQEDCADLSRRRADAVKRMLVDEFGVPEDQLITAGLGYEDDIFARGQDVDANGNFVETEAARNRRVVVIGANSEYGRRILGD